MATKKLITNSDLINAALVTMVLNVPENDLMNGFNLTFNEFFNTYTGTAYISRKTGRGELDVIGLNSQNFETYLSKCRFIQMGNYLYYCNTSHNPQDTSHWFVYLLDGACVAEVFIANGYINETWMGVVDVPEIHGNGYSYQSNGTISYVTASYEPNDPSVAFIFDGDGVHFDGTPSYDDKNDILMFYPNGTGDILYVSPGYNPTQWHIGK